MSDVLYHHRLFYGKIRQRLSDVVRKNKSSTHEREDYFSHLPVNVSEENFDIYDGLSGYFDDMVDYEGGKARMEVSLLELPPILQIQLQVSAPIGVSLQYLWLILLHPNLLIARTIQPRDTTTIQVARVRQI